MPVCDTCGIEVTETHLHHVLPRSLGGTDLPTNLVTVCLECHGKIHSMPKMASSSLIKKGIQRRRLQGKPWGRPVKADKARIEEVLSLRDSGRTYRQIAMLLNLSVGLVHNIVKKSQEAANVL